MSETIDIDPDVERANELLAAEQEEEEQLRLAMALLRSSGSGSGSGTEERITGGGKSKNASASPSPPPLSSSPTPVADTAASSSGSKPSEAATADKPSEKPKIDKKKKSFSVGMSIDSLLNISSTDEEERERRREKEERKAKAAAALEAAKAEKAAAAAKKKLEQQQQQQQLQQQQQRARSSPSPSPTRPASRSHKSSSSASSSSSKKSSRPTTGVSPSMHQPAASAQKTPSSSSSSSSAARESHSSMKSVSSPQSSTSPSMQKHVTISAPSPKHSSSSASSHHHHQGHDSHVAQPHSPTSSSSSHSRRPDNSNAALESRLRELEQHIHEHSYHLPSTSAPRPFSSPFSPAGESSRGATNALKMRILELEKENMTLQHSDEQQKRSLEDLTKRLEERDAAFEKLKATSEEKHNNLRTTLSTQISDLERTNYELTHEVQSLKSKMVTQENSYRDLVANGGKLTDLGAISKEELAKLQAEMETTEVLMKQMNKDNEKLHMELKIIENKYKNQIHTALEEQKTLRFEINNKNSEITNLLNAQNQILDPAAKEKIQSMNAAMNDLKEKHHQEISNLKYELDKLRNIQLELSIRKEDQTMQGKENLRLTLEAVQEKYNSYKIAKDKEVKELHAKLVWYIENQQLITNYEQQLQELKQENESLKDENIMMNHLIPAGTKSSLTGKEIKLKPRPIDVKRIKELEHKVVELTDIIKKKPGAASSPEIAGLISAIKPSMEEHELIQQLRNQLAEAQTNLTKKDEETLAKIRSLRQETDQMKLLYEKRVQKLTKDLADAQKKIPLTGRNKLNRISELERTIDELRRFYPEKLKRQSLLIGKLRRGERIDEKELHEVEQEMAEEQENAPQADVGVHSASSHPHDHAHSGHGESAHDSQPVGSRAPHHSPPKPHGHGHGHHEDALDPRSPLRAHPHPFHAPENATRDFLLFKQSVQEKHDQELHLITSRYEAQFGKAKLQWENQIQLIRATHEADMKLQTSLLQNAQDEVVRIRQALSNEMSQRSQMQARCLELESQVQQLRNEPAYCNYKELQHKLEMSTLAWETREKEYATAAATSLEDAKQERARWQAEIRSKSDQLSNAQVRFQQLSAALRDMQQQLQQQKVLIAHQQQQQQQQAAQQQELQKKLDQQRGAPYVPHRSPSPASPIAAPRAMPAAQIPAYFAAPAVSSLSETQPGASLQFLDETPMSQLMNGFSSRVHEPEDLLDPTLTTPALVNKENLELTWEFLMKQ